VKSGSAGSWGCEGATRVMVHVQGDGRKEAQGCRTTRTRDRALLLFQPLVGFLFGFEAPLKPWTQASRACPFVV
jgi:hypothetical protein